MRSTCTGPASPEPEITPEIPAKPAPVKPVAKSEEEK